MDRKRKILWIFILFMITLLIFTLYSNTLQSLSLPKVRAEKAILGSIEHSLEASSILQPLAEVKLLNPAGWKVTAIAVKEGDRVKKGQTLITYDSKLTERELKDEEAQLAKLKFDLQNSQDQFIAFATDGDEVKVRSARRDIEIRRIDIGVQERKIHSLKEKIENNKKIIAPFDGVITRLNAIEGMASMSEPDVQVANNLQGYRLEFMIDSSLLSSLGVTLKEKVPIEIRPTPGQEIRNIEGTVYEIADAAPRLDTSSNQEHKTPTATAQKIIRVQVIDSELKGGEQAFIQLKKRSSQEGLLISNEAIHQDREGKYVYRIEQQKGALGNNFIVLKTKIRSSESNDKETLILSFDFDMNDLIILESTEPLQNGNRIRLQ
ncbi:biotin/lipoyl-binding protein [Paenibacillus sp. UMB4589-SE434]|uniref:efflux RND transporter periplasmic adaptor subunit n=1 Tax=Paenibacillus sp. UMB4589-SE434 TaxID=3046314 RepID=UPI0025507247|nr:biotin/lipoyl-binding protein [Paenibacillus sp. UMB4589-SE434]MDK8180032.1 biotin/lipoyl-binding protein [Paenibacillus sp. UMB4589-SE434]